MNHDIYLCINYNRQLSNREFSCQRFSSYEEADKAFKELNKDDITASSMIPLYSLTPNCFRSFLLRYKVNTLWQTKIDIVDK